MGLFDFVGYGLLIDKYNGSEKLGTYLLLATIFVAICGYLLGSLNGAAIISKFILHDDVRRHGSKNAGMTNMIRVFGAKAGLLTVVIDVLKTLIAVFIGCILGRVTFLPCVAGLFCLIGHAYPVYFGFKGGKGVLVAATTALCLSIWTFIILVAIFGLIVWFTKYVSVASMVSALMFPFIIAKFPAYIISEGNKVPAPTLAPVFTLAMACAIIFLHRENIKRLKAGTENKIGKKKDGGSSNGN